MYRVVAPLLALALALAAVPAPVSAHSNDVRADSQVSTDGTVRVESVFVASEGWLVLHEDDDGAIGDPVGHRYLPAEEGFRTDVTVGLDGSVWREQSGNETYWVVLHTDDGDERFDPADDRIIESFGSPAADRFTLGKGDAVAYVTARRFALQESRGTVTVRRAVLPADGHVVLTTGENGTGDVVGHAPLGAGDHRNVTVALSESFFASQSETFSLTAVLYRGDGDDEFDDGDAPIRVGGAPVATRFAVEKTGAGGGATPATPTTATPTSTSRAPVNTPTATVTSTPADGTPADEPTDGTSTPAATPGGSPGDGGAADPAGPGFGPLVALVALVSGLLAVGLYAGRRSG